MLRFSGILISLSGSYVFRGKWSPRGSCLLFSMLDVRCLLFRKKGLFETCFDAYDCLLLFRLLIIYMK